MTRYITSELCRVYFGWIIQTFQRCIISNEQYLLKICIIKLYLIFICGRIVQFSLIAFDILTTLFILSVWQTLDKIQKKIAVTILRIRFIYLIYSVIFLKCYYNSNQLLNSRQVQRLVIYSLFFEPCLSVLRIIIITRNK